MSNTKRNTNKVNQVLSAWETKAPEAIFSGMSLTQCKTALKPLLDTEAKIAELKMQLQLLRKDYRNLSKDGLAIARRAVDGVRGDEAYGPNSSLYTAMGYVATGDRKSGLTRKGEAAAAPVEG